MKFSNPDSRGWFSLGLFVLALIIFGLLAHDPKLAENHLFATLAEAVLITGLINLAASFYFGASKMNETKPKSPDDA